MPKNEGKKFEEDFKKSCDNTDGVFFYRLKDGSASWGGNDLTRFQAKNDFDNFIYSIYGLCLLELKSTLGKSLPLGNIKQSQIDGLNKAANKNIDKLYAGFIINYRDCEETYYISVQQLNDFINKNERKSIPIDFCRDNGLCLQSKKLKVRYRYNINEFIKTIK